MKRVFNCWIDTLLVIMCFRSCNHGQQGQPSNRERTEGGVALGHRHLRLNSHRHHLQAWESPPEVPAGTEELPRPSGPAPGAHLLGPPTMETGSGDPADWGIQTTRVKRPVCLYTRKLMVTAMEPLRQRSSLRQGWAPSPGTENRVRFLPVCGFPGASPSSRKHPALKGETAVYLPGRKIGKGWKGRLWETLVDLLLRNADFFFQKCFIGNLSYCWRNRNLFLIILYTCKVIFL